MNLKINGAILIVIAIVVTLLGAGTAGVLLGIFGLGAIFS